MENKQQTAATAATGLAKVGVSDFNGGAFANFFVGLTANLVSIITLGLAFPAMFCWKLRWKAKHTLIDGKQLVFDGKAMQLLGKFLLWALLSIITFGIYYVIKMKINVIEWETEHTHFEGCVSGESKFDGRWYQLLGVNILTGFVTVITLSLGLYWAHCYRERWLCKHKTIDGNALYFDGKAGQLFGKCILWGLLTTITLGIYSFWLIVKKLKWTVSHTHCA